MSDQIELRATDGHLLNAYVARPAGAIVGSLVVLQEIFGVNASIREVADTYAAEGFLAIVPALFDRIEKHVELGYEAEDFQKALALMHKLDIQTALLDIEAALAYAEKESGRKAAVLGFCYGGKLAWLTSTRLEPSAAIGYYAGGIGEFAAEQPHAPTMLHFGSKDTHIPREQVEKVQAAHPDIPVYWYDADHAFANPARTCYAPEATAMAYERSLAFLKEHVGSSPSNKS